MHDSDIILVPANAIETSVNAIGPPVAGYNFTLTCTIRQTEGLLGIPSVLWVDADGQQINSTEDIVLSNPVTSDQTTNLTLYFDPIRTSDEGTYTCLATLSSSALITPLNSSALYMLTVQQSEISVHSQARA
jgi:hypothetical protein